jgi:uncharacterized cupin superfamily protein
MTQTKIQKPTPDQLNKLGISSWSSWDCNPSEFDWQYPSTEIAYVQKGRVIVTEEGGEEVEIKAGDLVTFPKGMKCRWKVIERIEKVYTFKS